MRRTMTDTERRSRRRMRWVDNPGAMGLMTQWLVMPVQWAPGRPVLGETRLRIAMLEQAFKDLHVYGAATEGKAKKIADDARRYVASDEREWPLAFLPCCEAVGLDASAVRRELKANGGRPRGEIGPRVVARGQQGVVSAGLAYRPRKAKSKWSQLA